MFPVASSAAQKLPHMAGGRGRGEVTAPLGEGMAKWAWSPWCQCWPAQPRQRTADGDLLNEVADNPQQTPNGREEERNPFLKITWRQIQYLYLRLTLKPPNMSNEVEPRNDWVPFGGL